LEKSEHKIEVRLFEPPTGAKIVVFSDPTGTEIDLMDLPD
jgi:hypothetical protein